MQMCGSEGMVVGRAATLLLLERNAIIIVMNRILSYYIDKLLYHLSLAALCLTGVCAKTIFHPVNI